MSETPFIASGPVGALHGTDRASVSEVPPLVLVHGINGSQDDWAEVAERLAQHRRTVTFDLRGHGASAMDGPFTATDYLDDLLAVLDDRGIERTHLVGASFGGSVALAAAALRPERVCSITAIGSALRVDDPPDIDGALDAMRAQGKAPVFAAVFAQISFAPGTDPALIEAAAERAAARDLDVIAAVTRAGFGADVTELAGRVAAPALVLVGEHDLTTPVAAADELARALSVQARVLPGRGHLAALEDPAAVADAVLAHVTVSDSAGAAR